MNWKILSISFFALTILTQTNQPTGQYKASQYHGQPVNLTLTFNNGNTSWSYCNNIQSTYTIVGNTINFENGVSWTRMYCPTLVEPQPEIFQAIRKSKTFTLNNNILKLFDNTETLLFQLKSSQAQTPQQTPSTIKINPATISVKSSSNSKSSLVGSWKLNILQNQSFSSTPSVLFTNDTIKFLSGLSNSQYTYKTFANTITITSTTKSSKTKLPVYSRMMINPLQDQIKQAFLQSSFYNISGNTLTLQNKNKQTLAKLIK